MVDFIQYILATPIPTLLVLAGIILLLLSVIARIGEKIVVDPNRQKHAALLGMMLLIVGLGLHLMQKPASDGCECLMIEISNTQQKLDESMHERQGIVSEMNRLKPFLETDRDAPAAYEHQERRLADIDQRIRNARKKLEDLGKRRDEVCHPST